MVFVHASSEVHYSYIETGIREVDTVTSFNTASTNLQVPQCSNSPCIRVLKLPSVSRLRDKGRHSVVILWWMVVASGRPANIKMLGLQERSVIHEPVLPRTLSSMATFLLWLHFTIIVTLVTIQHAFRLYNVFMIMIPTGIADCHLPLTKLIVSTMTAVESFTRMWVRVVLAFDSSLLACMARRISGSTLENELSNSVSP